MDASSDSVDFCTVDIASLYPQIDPDVEGVVGRLSAINKHISRTFDETLARHGLNHGEYRLLLRLTTRAEDNRMTAGELGRALLLSSGAMTNRIDRLEAAGLIERLRDPRDRRGVLVGLTPAGRTTIDRAVTEQAAKEIDVMGALGAKELKTLNGLLRKVLSSLEASVETEQPQAG
jgi:DNA-binding MarR family transcriptional regulator